MSYFLSFTLEILRDAFLSSFPKNKLNIPFFFAKKKKKKKKKEKEITRNNGPLGSRLPESYFGNYCHFQLFRKRRFRHRLRMIASKRHKVKGCCKDVVKDAVKMLSFFFEKWARKCYLDCNGLWRAINLFSFSKTSAFAIILIAEATDGKIAIKISLINYGESNFRDNFRLCRR